MASVVHTQCAMCIYRIAAAETVLVMYCKISLKSVYTKRKTIGCVTVIPIRHDLYQKHSYKQQV